MASGKKQLKPLASVGSLNKQPQPLEQMPRLKEMASVYRDQSTLKLHGNRMSVPPLKSLDTTTGDRAAETNGKPSATRSNSGSSIKSQEPLEKKELKEVKAKEKQLHGKIANLNKIIEELRKQLREKETTIDNLEVKIKMQENDYKEKIVKESHSHIQTKCSLEQKTVQLSKTKTELQIVQEEYEGKLKNMKEKLDKDLAQLRAEKDQELEQRENTLKKLKKQMADALMGNSRERQVQLEELTKELSRVQEESDVLTFKLRSYRSKTSTSCPGCRDLTEEVNRLKPLTRQQDETIKELQFLCAKLELQLSQQDELLKHWEANEQLKSLTPP